MLKAVLAFVKDPQEWRNACIIADTNEAATWLLSDLSKMAASDPDIRSSRINGTAMVMNGKRVDTAYWTLEEFEKYESTRFSRAFHLGEDYSGAEDEHHSLGAKDCFKILGLSPNITKKKLMKKYRKLALKYHPDVEGGNTRKFQIILQAKEDCLRRIERR